MSKSDSKGTCAACRYFDEGRCRRYPPQLASGIDTIYAFESEQTYLASESVLPIVKPEDWCGEFKEKHDEQK